MCKKLTILIVLLMTFVVAGCAPSMKHEYGIPINTDNVSKLVKGKSNKMDVITLFGMPGATVGYGGYGAFVYGGALNTNALGIPTGTLTTGDDQLYVYNHCVVGSDVSIDKKAFIPIVGGFIAKHGSESEEICEQLTVLVNKKDIVDTYLYYNSDPLSNETANKLVNGKSTKSNVIELFGAPSTLTASGNDELYVFKKCKMQGSYGLMSGMESKQDCKQLTIMLDKNNGLVKTYSYQPFQNVTKTN